MNMLLLAAVSMAMGASIVLAETPELLRLRAHATSQGILGRTRVDLVIERWSTPEEVATFMAILDEKRADQLLPALRSVSRRCGYVRRSGSPDLDVRYARETLLANGGRRIVLATDRPVTEGQGGDPARPGDFEFSLAEIHLGADGKGEGKSIPAARITISKDIGLIGIDNYDSQPVRLNEVRVLTPRE